MAKKLSGLSIKQISVVCKDLQLVGEDLLWAFCKIFYLQLSVSSYQWKKHCVVKILLAYSKDIFI